MSDRRKGIVYGVGVGPGDPELMTIKACRLISENQLIIVAGKEACDSAAYRIAAEAVPEIADKQVIAVDMPMTRDEELLRKSHRKAADIIEKELDAGINAVYLTLGDPAIYCSFSYLKAILERDGYETVMVSGIPSFCAAAARLGVPLAEGDTPLHVVPSLSGLEAVCGSQGNCVIMKSGRKTALVKEILKDARKDAMAVENCCMDGERVYTSLDEIPNDAGYFTLMIAGNGKEAE